MRTESFEFLRELIFAPSPSGYESPAQNVVRAYMERFADRVESDVHGNLAGTLNVDAPMRVMLAGHTDQIGFIVNHVDSYGFLWFGTLGGFDPAVVAGTSVLVHTAKGPVPGVIGRKPIHLMEQKERTAGAKIENMWIDIGAGSRAAAVRKVRIADAITIAPHLTKLSGGRIAAAGLDDKAGTFVIAEALRLLSASKRLKVAVHAVSTVQEEMGLRGATTAAFGVKPHVGIAVDVTFATDGPAADRAATQKLVGEVSLGKGPVLARSPFVNHVLHAHVERVAKSKRIAIQHQVGGRGTDANAIQLSRAGVASGLVSVPNRYMHTPVEVVDLKDMERAARLVAAAVEALSPGMDFRPH